MSPYLTENTVRDHYNSNQLILFREIVPVFGEGIHAECDKTQNFIMVYVELNPKFPRQKAASNKKKVLVTSKLDLNLRRKP